MTLKQKIAFKKIIENHGNVSKAMIEAGYTPATAKNPKNLTTSKGFEELREEYLPDPDIFEMHKQGLYATKIHTSHTEPDREIADYPTRLKAVEMAYKIKGKLKEGMNVAGDVVMNVTIVRNADTT